MDGTHTLWKQYLLNPYTLPLFPKWQSRMDLVKELCVPQASSTYLFPSANTEGDDLGDLVSCGDVMIGEFLRNWYKV